MAGEWSTAPLDSLVDEILDRRGVTVRKLRSEFVPTGHRVISAKLVKSGRIDLHADEARFVDEATYKRWMRTPLLADDVILTSEAPLGEVAYLGAANDWVLGQRLFAIRTDKRRLHGRFLYYALKSESMIHGLQSRATGTTAQGIRQSELRRVKVPLPPLAEQRRIAGILGALDDKIELNRRTNETLEAIARALFKSWFVDFDPVRAKSEGRDPGLPPHLADLFPDSFEDSELGDIPKGWPALALADCVDAARGLSYKGSGLSDSGKPMHNLNSIYEGGGYKPEGIKHYEGDYKSHHLVRVGDVIVANTEQGHNRRLIGYAALVPGGVGDESLFSHHLYRLRPGSSSGLTPDYLCHLLNTGVMHDTVSGYANGTTVNMLPIDGVRRPLVVVPSSGIVRAFDGLAAAARLRHEKLIDESRTLAALRNTLLPKLISGELRVADAERVVEAAL